MPELPEVQTVVSELEQSLQGRMINDVITYRDNIRYPIPDLSKIISRKVSSVKRRAKYIIVNIETIKQPLIIHLGMSGKIKIGTPVERIKHDHVVFELDNGNELVFNDARRFGFVIFGDDNYFDNLGVEPLTEEFDATYLYNKLKTKTQPIKTAIMDQRLVVGVGNIYASEALFRSGIAPTRPCNKVSKAKCEIFVSNIKQVLNEAIASGGSTLRDYVRSSGDLGYFQHSHAVYGKEGKPCVSCGSEIKMLRQGGRSSFYCKKCQK